MSGKEELIAHLKTGASTTCRAWSVTRKDGLRLGFTDHDRDLEFEGLTFKACSGMTAGALQQTNGLAVDNTEVVGALSDDAISEVDLLGGRYDSAEVVTYLVNWANVGQRSIRFRGTFGEIQHSQGSFRVELRGLTDALNRSGGRVYQPNCSAVLGDAECRFDLMRAEFSFETNIKVVGNRCEYLVPPHAHFADRWFERGQITVMDGPAKGMDAIVKFDEEINDFRRVELWIDFGIRPEAGDRVKIVAGCDKLATTCRTKFGNFLNFRGFPNIPSADWMASYPTSSERNDGGSRTK